MPDITITDAECGLVQTMVARSERVSPHIVRVTFSGGELDKLVYQGFDQWFRLALPISDGAKLENVPTTFGFGGLLTFMALPKDTRPVIRNDTIRDFRAGSASAGSCGASDGSETEMNVDFVVHGTEGIAGPARALVAGERLRLHRRGVRSHQGRSPPPGARPRRPQVGRDLLQLLENRHGISELT
ncbi:MAG: siderophore-interacting protein [Candidatus Corynebacterium faecigallinarum]